ncbi:Alcohol dehydrogenase GroES-like domain [Propionibacterium ruminifibrarum]|uniref:Alcohol dehydrogenase GroES-like domain n=1 Tax=Propionibacterium ruminifibrarum TaxID=1962131 RepID=A0A375I724_9ACTN|nr:zinc-binding dehydrogenase [Propionibacterium ruminifibrarum]SPF69061.1 Alcohol dehydrogenase GroES-like domain [Propionibacterium ruminifibrarum]
MTTMKAIRLTGPTAAEDLHPVDVPVPEPRPGWVRVAVKAFGVNESEVTSRRGQSSPDFSFPRILGIECVGVVDAVDVSSTLTVGQQVATMMGGMGRGWDGSYAEYVLVPEDQLITFTSDLPWEVLGALPEMLQTAHGSLHRALRLDPGQTLLVHGGTSTVGLTATSLAHNMGATVLATSRKSENRLLLEHVGADHVVIDDDTLAEQVSVICPNGLDAVLELVGADALPATLALLKPGGIGCFTGALNGHWTLGDVSPFELVPVGVRLTTYAGEASDLDEASFDGYLKAIAAGSITPVTSAVYRGLARVGQAHHDLEHDRRPGKCVVVL